MLGTCGGTGFYVFGAIEYQMATTPGFSRPELARFIDASEEASILLPILILFLVGIVIGLIVLGIAAWRRGLIPIWGGLLIVAAGVLAFLSESGVLSVVSFVVLLAGLGGSAWRSCECPTSSGT
jgi:hypothetical protein